MVGSGNHSGSVSGNEFDPINGGVLLKEDDSGSQAPDDEEFALCIPIRRSH